MKLITTDFTGYINLGSGKTSSVESIAKIVSELSGKEIKSLNIPVDGVMDFKADIGLLKKLINWNPKYSLKRGLKKTFEVIKNNLEVSNK